LGDYTSFADFRTDSHNPLGKGHAPTPGSHLEFTKFLFRNE